MHAVSVVAHVLQRYGILNAIQERVRFVQERRPERNGSLRVLYAARIGLAARAHCAHSVKNRAPLSNRVG